MNDIIKTVFIGIAAGLGTWAAVQYAGPALKSWRMRENNPEHERLEMGQGGGFFDRFDSEVRHILPPHVRRNLAMSPANGAA